MDTVTEIQSLGKIVLAAFSGGLVGIEREFAAKPAGLRTHMLVGAVSAFFVMLGTQIVSSFEQQNLIAADPIRILQAIVVGISFLIISCGNRYRRRRRCIHFGNRCHILEPAYKLGTYAYREPY